MESSAAAVKQLMIDLPLIDYKELHPTRLDVTKFVPCPKFVPSNIIQFDPKKIEHLGLKPETNWKQQTKEFEEYKTKDSKQRIVKRFLWVRHGEGIHNAAEREFGSHQWETVEAKKDKYFDPDLNAVGFEQAKRLGHALYPHLEDGLKVDLIIVSPLTRAIRTAELAFSHIWDKVPVVAVELARERHGKNICDKRRTTEELKKAFPSVIFDEHMVGETDEWYTERRETPAEVRHRVKRLMGWMMELPCETIAIVGHSDFMSHAVEAAGYPSHWPANCEMVPMMVQTSEDYLDSVAAPTSSSDKSSCSPTKAAKIE